MRVIRFVAAFVLTAVALEGSSSAYSPIAEFLDRGYAIAPDKLSKSFVVFDASKASTASDKTATAWSFKLTDGDSAFQSVMGGSNGPLTNPDEAKFRDGGRTLLVTGSWLSGWAEIDVATKRVRRYAKTGTTSASLNTHSIEKLPDGSLVVANSTGSAELNNALVLITIDANGNPAYKKLFSLYGAHGVEWDETRNCLWACGNSSSDYTGRATLYKLTYDPDAQTLTLVDSLEYRSESSTIAHALRLSANGMICCSAGDIYKVNPDTRSIEKFETSTQTKGVHFDPAYGMVYQISGNIPGATDSFLNDHVSVVPIAGEAYDVYPAGATRMYKVGWASAWPAMFVPYISSGESFWCGGDGCISDGNWVNDVRTNSKAALKSGNRLVFGGYESPDVAIGSATTVAGISAAHGTTTLAGSALTLTAGIETIDSDAVVIIKNPVSGPIAKTGKGTLVLEGDLSGVTAMDVQSGTVAISNALPTGVTATVAQGAELISAEPPTATPDEETAPVALTGVVKGWFDEKAETTGGAAKGSWQTPVSYEEGRATVENNRFTPDDSSTGRFVRVAVKADFAGVFADEEIPEITQAALNIGQEGGTNVFRVLSTVPSALSTVPSAPSTVPSAPSTVPSAPSTVPSAPPRTALDNTLTWLPVYGVAPNPGTEQTAVFSIDYTNRTYSVELDGQPLVAADGTAEFPLASASARVGALGFAGNGAFRSAKGDLAANVYETVEQAARSGDRQPVVLLADTTLKPWKGMDVSVDKNGYELYLTSRCFIETVNPDGTVTYRWRPLSLTLLVQ